MFLWRISNHLSLAGDGALRAPGRWHTRARRVVYCAQSPAAALLEILVHFEIDIQDLPVRYRLLKIEGPDDVQVENVSIDQLSRDWPERTEVTRALGDGWLTTGSAALTERSAGDRSQDIQCPGEPSSPGRQAYRHCPGWRAAIDPGLLK